MIIKICALSYIWVRYFRRRWVYSRHNGFGLLSVTGSVCHLCSCRNLTGSMSPLVDQLACSIRPHLGPTLSRRPGGPKGGIFLQPEPSVTVVREETVQGHLEWGLWGLEPRLSWLLPLSRYTRRPDPSWIGSILFRLLCMTDLLFLRWLFFESVTSRVLWSGQGFVRRVLCLGVRHYRWHK